MKTSVINEQDVLVVASRIGINDLTYSEIEKILEEHDIEQRADPTGTWNEVVENQIYFILDDREEDIRVVIEEMEDETFGIYNEAGQCLCGDIEDYIDAENWALDCGYIIVDSFNI